MKFYMLVEGKSTEVKVYPKIIEYYRPEMQQVFDLSELKENRYFIYSGMGIPSLYDKIWPTVEDIRMFNASHEQKIDFLLISLDADVRGSVEATYEKIVRELQKANADEIDWRIIIQNKCIESWFLGNAEAFPKNYSEEFKPYAEYFNVAEYDPEEMESPQPESMSVGTYTKKYLKKMLRETGGTYTERKVNTVTSKEYIAGMQKRIEDTEHLNSFREFVEWLEQY